MPNDNSRIVLAADGDFNVGASSDGEMVRLLESHHDQGTYLTVLGNCKDSKLETLSNAGNGNARRATPLTWAFVH